MSDLKDIMEFGHVIRVQDGVATDTMPDGSRIELYAPECVHEGFGGRGTPITPIEPGTGWTLMAGYSGQDRYSGPIMHASEYIGGRLETDILATDGYYVAVECEVAGCDNTCDDPCEYADSGHPPDGWAVAYRPL